MPSGVGLRSQRAESVRWQFLRPRQPLRHTHCNAQTSERSRSHAASDNIDGISQRPIFQNRRQHSENVTVVRTRHDFMAPTDLAPIVQGKGTGMSGGIECQDTRHRRHEL